ncbi:MAG: DUF6493 family protein [Janthinobacterium lividum]
MPNTLETFEQLVRHRTSKELLPFLLTLDKSDLVPVRQRTLSLEKELQASFEPTGQPDQTRSQLTAQRAHLLFLAGLATYSAKEARRLNPWYGNQLTLPEGWTAQSEVPPFLAIIQQFRPAWLGEWLLRRTRENRWSVPQYALLRELLASELLVHDSWLTAQSVAHLPTHYNWRRNQGGDIPDFDQLILAELRADETLRHRDLPLLLDFDTMADTAGTWSGQERTPVTWQTLLVALLASGHLDRGEWLTHCLLALRRDFRRPLLTWLKTLYTSLKPTPKELLARQNELLELLSHPLPLVVNFALDQLKEIWALPDFELAALLLPAEALLSRQDLKTGLRTLLTGLDRLLKADPTQAAPLARLYASALAHADAGVQERAAKSLAALLGAKKPLLSAADATEATATSAAYAELLGPPARAALAPWLAAAPNEPAASVALERYEPAPDFQPELSADTAVVPVADWHELLFLTGQVLKHDDPLALERWLEGLLRLQAELPADYADQLQPYLPQLITWGREPDQPLTVEQAQEVVSKGQLLLGHLGSTQALILSWMLGFAEPLVPLLTTGQYEDPDPLVVADRQRLVFAEKLLRGRRALPLLSTPTHAPHWLAPTALVQRLLAYEAAHQQPDPTDLAVALARLGWAAKADATAATEQLPHLRHAGLRELLNWVLAPTIAPLPASASAISATPQQAPLTKAAGLLPLAAALPWLWAVAARTRQPAGEFPALAALTPPDCANVMRPCAMGWEIVAESLTRKITWKPGVTEETEHWLELRVQPLVPVAAPPMPVALYALYPAAPPAPKYRWNALTALATNYRYLASLLPQYPAPLHWQALTLAAMRDSGEIGPRQVLSEVLRELLAPGPAFEEPATLLLAVSLTHQQPPVRALALEALLSATDHGRLVPAALAAALGKLISVGFVPLPRLTAGLMQARAISPRTDDALRQLLEALLPALPAAPLRQTGALLTLYTDLPGRTSHPVPAPVQARLREWGASASLKKLVAPLLA